MKRRKFNLSKLLYRNISKSLNRVNPSDLEELATLIEGSSKFLWNYHTGIYRDPIVDNLIAKHFSKSSQKNTDKVGEFSIIHIATKLYPTGGHTEFLVNFVESVKKFPHVLILTSQDDQLPERIVELVEKNEVRLILLKSETLVEKITELESSVNTLSGMILLSTHPNDIVPDAALRENTYNPVVTFNHADHVYWLGASVSDIVLNYRDIGESISRSNRGLQGSHRLFLLPRKPTESDDHDSIDELDISSFKRVCLTVCAEYKIRPLAGQNFYRFLTLAAARFPDTCFIVVGPTKMDFNYRIPESNLKNIFFTGKTDNIDKYLKVSDFYIDPYPLTSLMSLYEAVSFGLFPIVNPYPLSKLFYSEFEYEEGFFKDFFSGDRDPEKYYLEVLGYCFDNEDEVILRRKGLQKKFNSKCNAENFEKKITVLIEECSNVNHTVNSNSGEEDESEDSVLLNEILVNDVDMMFSDFLKISKYIPRTKIFFLYLYFMGIRLMVKDRSSFNRPTRFFLRRLLKNK